MWQGVVRTKKIGSLVSCDLVCKNNSKDEFLTLIFIHDFSNADFHS